MYVLWICYQSELRLLKSLILLRCRRPVIILALCNRVFNNSQLPTDYCHLYALLPPSVSLWAGSNVLFSPYSPFSGHSGLLYYQQPPRRKIYWNRCWNFFEICTYRLSLVGPDGKKVGSISWRTDQAQRGPCAMTESQKFSRSARPDITDEYFIIWPITIENFENFVSDLIWRDRRALAGNKKDSTIKFSSVFSSQNNSTTTHRKTATFFTLSFLFFKFLQQSCVRAGPDGFSGPAHVNPSGNTHLSFHCCFFGGLRVRGFTGLMMIMHKRRSEEFVNVFNSTILYWLTADSKRVEYSVNLTKLVQLLSSISDFWSMVCLSFVSQLLSVS